MTTSEAQNITGSHWEEFKEWSEKIKEYTGEPEDYYHPWDVQKFMRQFEER